VQKCFDLRSELFRTTGVDLTAIDGINVLTAQTVISEVSYQAATSLLRSESYLGAQYRRLRTKLGTPKAKKAMANRLARIT